MLLLQGLRYQFVNGPALAFADLAVPQGAVVLVRGPSGSGKSTLLALMAGLLPPSAGQLLVAGSEPARMGERARDAWRAATLGFVPQRLHLSGALDVQANLELPYVGTGEAVDKPRIAALLQRLGLHGLQRRRPHELSLGQAQRVALARALLRRPRLILADEPSANLDDTACAQAAALLCEQASEEGATLVVASHDARIVSALGGAATLVLPGLGA